MKIYKRCINPEDHKYMHAKFEALPDFEHLQQKPPLSPKKKVKKGVIILVAIIEFWLVLSYVNCLVTHHNLI